VKEMPREDERRQLSLECSPSRRRSCRRASTFAALEARTVLRAQELSQRQRDWLTCHARAGCTGKPDGIRDPPGWRTVVTTPRSRLCSSHCKCASLPTQLPPSAKVCVDASTDPKFLATARIMPLFMVEVTHRLATCEEPQTRTFHPRSSQWFAFDVERLARKSSFFPSSQLTG
jgi:hypothetical protein